MRTNWWQTLLQFCYHFQQRPWRKHFSLCTYENQIQKQNHVEEPDRRLYLSSVVPTSKLLQFEASTPTTRDRMDNAIKCSPQCNVNKSNVINVFILLYFDVLKIKAFTITINAINIMPMKSGTVSTSSLPLQFILRHST